MWFHLLSVATFLALGSCHTFFGHSRRQGTSDCLGLDCPCSCSDNACPPCPIPEPFQCLSGCGTSGCPCVNVNGKQRSHGTGLGLRKTHNVEWALALSTVNVKPTGPVCTAANIKQNMMLTVSTCVAGIALEDLYVSAVTDGVEALKVTKILTDPFDNSQPSPVVLVTKPPANNLVTLVLPARPIDMTRTAEIQKFEVREMGMVYVPLKTKAKAYAKCNLGEDLICAETYNTTVMGWNDIGSVLVELRDNVNWLQGMYTGAGLYEPTNIVKYLPLYKYEEWLYSVIAKYS